MEHALPLIPKLLRRRQMTLCVKREAKVTLSTKEAVIKAFEYCRPVDSRNLVTGLGIGVGFWV